MGVVSVVQVVGSGSHALPTFCCRPAPGQTPPLEGGGDHRTRALRLGLGGRWERDVGGGLTGGIGAISALRA